MKKILVVLATAFACLCLNAQNYKVDLRGFDCSDSELDGSVTVKAWGIGRNVLDASEQARKNAVYAAVFYGFRSSGVKPLVTEVNAEEKYSYFFNLFFKDGGEYRRFTSLQDKRAHSKKKIRQASDVKAGFYVRVRRSELQAYLIEKEIIKP